jgi:hypothetical protein
MINHECTRIDTNFINDEIRMSNVEGMTKVEILVGFLTLPFPLGLVSDLPVYVARSVAAPFCESRKRSGLAQTPYNLVIRICFVISHSCFVIRFTCHHSKLKFDVSPSLDMTSEE